VFSAILLVAPPLLLSGYYFYEKFSRAEFMAEAGVASLVYRAVLPYFFDWIAFLGLYFLVPKAPVRFVNACFGGFVAAILFNLAKAGFGLYLRDFATYSTLYKSIAAVPVSLVWLYLSWIILLFGAEISYQCQYLPRVGSLFKQSVLSVGDARMMLAIQSLVFIERAFAAGRALPSDIELAERLGCSTVVLKPTIDALEKAGIVARGDSREMPVTLLRSAERISLAEVRDALFGARSALHFPDAMSRLFKSLASGQGLGEVSLAHIVSETPKNIN